ncbi:MAG TPA: JAB domain-containing protein, partial [Pricia sp.]|nr:JAB domain-containing protein [Pricia sp.]
MSEKDIQITHFKDFVGEMTNIYRRTEVLSEQIKHAGDAFRFIYPYFDEIMDDHEEFKVIHMNSAGFVVNVHHATSGTDGATLVSVKDIMRQAILCKTITIICVHNHPSGTLMPSKGDKDVTNK